MAVATKAAAFGVVLRFFDVAVIDAVDSWAPALATLAVVTIVVGNVGAIGQSSLKRLLAYSSVAQAGYMLAGVVVTTQLGVRAAVFYLAVYLLMNLAAFAVIVARERETGLGDDISSLYGLGADRPLLAWPMTIAMLSLAGFPATAGFFGKVYLIDAAVDNGYAWLGVVIVIGSAISLAYYLRVVAAVWMRAPGEAPRRGRASRRRRAAGDRRRVAEADADPEAVAARAARATRRLRQPEVVGTRGRVRGGDGLLRDLPEPAARPGARRGRGRSRTCSEVRRATDGRALLAETSVNVDASRRRRSPRGENSARGALSSTVRPSAPTPARPPPEYVALLSLIAAVLGGARRAAVPRASASVVATVRTGMCIVGGDVCRTADAAAAGLAPCVTGERSTRQDTTLDIAVVRLGGARRVAARAALRRHGGRHPARGATRAA